MSDSFKAAGKAAGNPPRTESTQADEGEIAIQFRTEIDRLSRLLRSTNSTGSAGLPPARISVLLAVDRHGQVRLSEIARHQRLHPTMLSRIVGHLVAGDLVQRGTDPEDRRSAWLTPTERGHALATRIQSERAEMVRLAIQGLDEHHRRSLVESLPALRALVEVLQQQPV